MIGLDDIEKAKARLIAGSFLALALVLAGIGLYALGRHDGARLEQAKVLEDKEQRGRAEKKLLLEQALRVAALEQKHNDDNRKVSEDHEKELDQLRHERDAARAESRRNGGLRIARTVCDTPAAGTEAAGDGRRDEAASGTIQLPTAVEDGLWAIVNRADEVVEQARACQSWIRRHGFYGPADDPNPVLLDRIDAAPKQDTEVKHD